jgi:spermidine synthase
VRAPRRTKPEPVSTTATGRPLELYVLGTSFLTGAITLVVEILGTRIMSPYYGASIYVWSSLIGVTLGALTIGYLVGGSAADRWPPLRAFALEIVAAALWISVIPLVRHGVLSATTPLGLKAGSLVSAFILFAPPLVLLSMTGPSAIRLVTTDFAVLGRGVGKVYGVSTLGSTLGAILTGFVLIPSFSVPTLLVACAIVLLVLGGLGLALARTTAGAVTALVVAVIAAFAGARSSVPAPGVVYVANSFYGELKVFETRDVRLLLLDGIDNGFVDRTTFESRAPYISSFRYLPAARPAAAKALCIGLGAGSVPRTFHVRHKIATEVVEIDSEIVQIARRWFGFPSEIPVFVEDGRTFMAGDRGPYDFVVLDAFRSETHPAHLFTREFFARVDAALAPEGIVALNMAGVPYGPASVAWRSVRRTLREQFANVRVFAGAASPGADVPITNLFIVASQGPLPSPETAGLAALARNEIPVGDEDADAVIVTDDYNPVDDMQRGVLVGWRELMIKQAAPLLLTDDAA